MATVQEREILTEFIEVYRDNPCLWDTSILFYKNKEMKHDAWILLTDILKKLDPDANVASTKKKVENLRAVYFRELKKVRASRVRATDERDVFVPNLWYFKLINFLDRDDWGRCRRASDPLWPTEGEGSIKQAPLSDEESVESVVTPEPVIEEELPLPLKRNCKKSQSRPRKFKRNSDQINHVHTVETFAEPFHYTEPQPTFQESTMTSKKSNSFGIYVGEQLDQTSTFQRDVAEKLISDILFLAKTGNLTYDSRIEIPSKLLNANTNSYSSCQSPDYNIVSSSPRKLEMEADCEGVEVAEPPRTLLKELLTEKKHK